MAQPAPKRIALGLRAWQHGLTQPFYVPGELQQVRLLLSDGRVLDATRELRRLATTGSVAAAATLGYMLLVCGELSGIDCNVVTGLCQEAANRGYSYAQYVVAWRQYECGNYADQQKWLHRAARQRFAPAVCDLGRLLVEGVEISSWRSKLGRSYFLTAFYAGHLMSIVFFLRYCKEKKFGAALKVLGILTLPVARAALLPLTWFCPFSIKVFSYPTSRKKPLFTTMH